MFTCITMGLSVGCGTLAAVLTLCKIVFTATNGTNPAFIPGYIFVLFQFHPCSSVEATVPVDA